MTLIVEDGTGLPEADSYASVDFADAYHAARGNTVWADYDTTEVKEPALRKATDYMVQMYRERWQGYRLLIDQALDWPRTDVVVYPFALASDIVPAEVAQACVRLALLIAGGAELTPPTERVVIREKVGPLETEYAPGYPAHTVYRDIDALLQPFLSGGGSRGSVSLVRG